MTLRSAPLGVKMPSSEMESPKEEPVAEFEVSPEVSEELLSGNQIHGS